MGPLILKKDGDLGHWYCAQTVVPDTGEKVFKIKYNSGGRWGHEGWDYSGKNIVTRFIKSKL